MGFFDFLDSNNHVLSKIDSSGKLYDRNNHVIGKITWGGDVQDANNHTLGHISSSGKVDGFVTVNPLAKQHDKYPLIQANIKAASLRMTIDIDTTWAREETFNF